MAKNCIFLTFQTRKNRVHVKSQWQRISCTGNFPLSRNLYLYEKVWKSAIKSHHDFCGKMNSFSVKSTFLLNKLLNTNSWFHGKCLSVITFPSTFSTLQISVIFTQNLEFCVEIVSRNKLLIFTWLKFCLLKMIRNSYFDNGRRQVWNGSQFDNFSMKVFFCASELLCWRNNADFWLPKREFHFFRKNRIDEFWFVFVFKTIFAQRIESLVLGTFWMLIGRNFKKFTKKSSFKWKCRVFAKKYF